MYFPWRYTCSGVLPGSLSYEKTDVEMLLDFEVDYFKANLKDHSQCEKRMLLLLIGGSRNACMTKRSITWVNDAVSLYLAVVNT
jgi:hypothetical protein